MKSLSAVLFIIALHVVSLAPTWAQAPGSVNDGNQTGTPPFGTFSGSNFDLVSFQNGNLHLQLPLRSVPQRNGKTISWRLLYDTPDWILTEDLTIPNATIDYDTDSPGMRVASTSGGIWLVTNDLLDVNCGGTFYTIDDNYVLTDSDGTRHPLFLQNTNGNSPCTTVSKKSMTQDGTGVLVDLTTGLVTLKDGTQVSPWKDSNGNIFSPSSDTLGRNTLSPSGVGSQTYTTPLGHTINGPQYTLWTYTDSNGSTQSYRLDFQAIDINTHFCPSSPPCVEYTDTWLLPTTLKLPNNAGTYKFTWQNNDVGELT